MTACADYFLLALLASFFTGLLCGMFILWAWTWLIAATERWDARDFLETLRKLSAK